MNEIIMGKCEVYSSLIIFQVLICPNQKIDTRVQTTKKVTLRFKRTCEYNYQCYIFKHYTHTYTYLFKQKSKNPINPKSCRVLFL